MSVRPFAPLVLLATGLLTTGLVSACGLPDTSSPLPAAKVLLDDSAAALRDLRDVRFEYSLNGRIPELDVRSAQGRASANGAAEGEAEIETPDGGADVSFVVEGDTVTVTAESGGTERLPGASPNAATLLNPDTGLPSLLAAATDVRTENREELDGVSAYRVGGDVDRATISRLLPGAWADVEMKFWVSEGEGRELLRLWLQLPPRTENEGTVMLELALSDHNAQDGAR